jgi:hypothetical protein
MGATISSRVILCAALAGVLSACSSMPPFDAPPDSAYGPTVSDIVQKIECEVAAARDENDTPAFRAYLRDLGLADFSQWAASVTLSLTVNDTAGLNPSSGLVLTYLQPLSVPGTSFGFGGAIQLYQQRSRIFTQTYTLDLKAVSVRSCRRFEGTPPRINLAGDLGLRDQIYMGLHAFHRREGSDYATKPGAGAPDSFGADRLL